ncbi:MAG: hypothetical protein KAT65_19405, partial [Methanophagales archaeon]|nr:hypothetical protein [Methanophagales archaeon]
SARVQEEARFLKRIDLELYLRHIYENRDNKEHKPRVFKRGEVKLLIGDSVGKSKGEGKKGF